MAMIQIIGPEEGDFSHAYTTSGTTSVQSSVKPSWAAYAIRVNPTTTATGFSRWTEYSAATGLVIAPAAGSSSTYYHKLWLRVDTLPSASSEEFYVVEGFGASVKVTLRINSAGKVEVWQGGTTLTATGTITLSTGTWYCVECSVTATTGTISTWIDDTLDVNAAAITYSVTNASNVIVGKYINRNSQTVDYYIASVEVSNSGRCGLSRVTGMVPTAAGNYQQGTPSTGSNHWACMDERPHNGVTDYVSVGNTLKETNGGFSCSGAGISGTINGIKTAIVMGHDTTYAYGEGQLLVRSGSTDSYPTSSYAQVVVAYKGIGWIYSQDPNTSAAWTTSGVDGVEGGLLGKSATRVPRLTQLVVSVSWTPAAGGGAVIPVFMAQYRQRWR